MNIKFYFDYVSPNAYLAWTQIPRVTSGRDIDVEPIPVLFSALLDAHGQRGPAEVPEKMRWMVKNVLRKANQLDVPINPPASHPFNPLLALRVSCLPISPKARQALINAIFEAAWVTGIDVADPEALAEVLEAAGLDSRGLISQAGSSETKAQLRKNTSAAVETGVFGVPSVQVGSELFWGLDDFGNLAAYLENRDVLGDEDLVPWSNLRASAWRKNES